MTDAQLAQLKRKRDLHMVLPVFLVSVIACIDRVNIAYAKLTMEQDLPWLTPEIFGMGASIFFVGYLIFEVPGALVAARFSAAKWIARIMLTCSPSSSPRPASSSAASCSARRRQVSIL